MGHVPRMGERKNAYGTLVKKKKKTQKVKRSPARRIYRLKDCIKMYLISVLN
jgi:hypothetical protein